MGVTPLVIANAIASTNVGLTCQGNQVAWHAEGTNFFFYGLPAASYYAPENVYWVALTNGAGTTMSLRADAWGDPPTTNARCHVLCGGRCRLHGAAGPLAWMQ